MSDYLSRNRRFLKFVAERLRAKHSIIRRNPFLEDDDSSDSGVGDVSVNRTEFATDTVQELYSPYNDELAHLLYEYCELFKGPSIQKIINFSVNLNQREQIMEVDCNESGDKKEGEENRKEVNRKEENRKEGKGNDHDKSNFQQNDKKDQGDDGQEENYGNENIGDKDGDDDDDDDNKDDDNNNDGDQEEGHEANASSQDSQTVQIVLCDKQKSRFLASFPANITPPGYVDYMNWREIIDLRKKMNILDPQYKRAYVYGWIERHMYPEFVDYVSTWPRAKKRQSDDDDAKDGESNKRMRSKLSEWYATKGLNYDKH